MDGIIFDIKKFALHDGPGIRTTVFLKGCPLRCLWCHNPESQEPQPEISFQPRQCIGCGWCFAACPHHCHAATDKVPHAYCRNDCTRCGKCTEQCYAQALEIVGVRRNAPDIIAEILRDKPFYEASGGGLTLSGGEPLFQPEFALELATLAHQAGLHVCLDTCGQAQPETILQFLPVIDIFLFDWKATAPDEHRRLTGFDNRLIRANLQRLDEAGAALILRCPLVPGLNDTEEHLTGIAQLANSLRHVREITINPFHPLGDSKCERLGRPNPLPDHKTFAPEETIAHWLETVRSQTDVPVHRA